MTELTNEQVHKRVSSILHITVGIDNVWEPTTDEISAIVNSFTAALNESTDGLSVAATRNGIEVNRISVPADVPAILHITVGIDNVWEPTDEEIQELKHLFQEALESDSDLPIVATRNGVSATVVGLEDHQDDMFDMFPFGAEE
jgi:hypothetical protein